MRPTHEQPHGAGSRCPLPKNGARLWQRQRAVRLAVLGAVADDLELWAANDRDEAIYVVRGDTVERWPRAREFIACA